jgi:glucose-1-phosphate adenylyltransferase
MYLIIDFVLSNLMHAGIESVGILSQYRPHDLVRHIGTGEHWDFIGRRRNVFMLPPYRGSRGSDWYRGTADAVYQNISFINEFEADIILIASADHIYRMNYHPLIRFHQENKADATICFTKVSNKSSRFGYGVVEKGRLITYHEKPSAPPSDLASMTIYVFNRHFLIDVLMANARAPSHEFGRDIIPAILETSRVYGYVFTDYWAYARTITSYYNTNMDLLQGKIPLHDWQIRTNLTERNTNKDRVPAYINGRIHNSLISDECAIEGSVRNSLLSPGVKVAPDAEIVDSIIFHDTTIGKNTRLHRVICDKDVHIENNVTIGYNGREIPSREFGELMCEGFTVIDRKMSIPSGITIGANTVIYSGAQLTEEEIPPGSTVR